MVMKHKELLIVVGIVVILTVYFSSNFAFAYQTNEVIITTNNLLPYAKQLAKIHESKGINSKIVTVEYIWKNYKPANAPPIHGYVNDSKKYIDKYLKAYNYTLAMKIISYLRTQVGKVEYVTLFGDVKAIPPSYYIDLRENIVPLTPTDFFYASPDYSMKPVFAVGRIPASNTNEAKTYVNKLRNYYNHFNITQFRRALIYGGYITIGGPTKDFDGLTVDYFYVWQGEAEVADLMDNFNLTSKFNTSIYLGSDGYNFPYMVKQFNKAFSGGYGLVFHDNHGMEAAIQIHSGDAYSIANLQRLHKIRGYVMPIFLSEGCDVAAYDMKLLKIPIPPFDPRKECFESFLVLHNPGAIVAIGSTRTTAGQENFNVTNGYVNIISSDFIDVIESRVIKDIGNVPTIGYAFKDALTHYVEKYDLKPKTPKWKDKRERFIYQVYFQTVLLGDPTLNLPKLSLWKVHYPRYEFLTKPVKYVRIYDDITNKYWNYPYYEGEMKIKADEPLTLKFFYLSSDSVPLVNRTKVEDGQTYTFIPEKTGLYLLRISNNEKEVWYAFYITKENEEGGGNGNKTTTNHPPVVEKIPDIHTYVGKEVIVHINATDPDGDKLTCRAVRLPKGAVLDNFEFYWVPKNPGNYTVVFVVSDGKANVEGQFKIYVKKVKEVKAYPVSPKNGETDVSLSPVLKAKIEGLEGNYVIEYYSGDGYLIGKGNAVVWKNLKPGRVYKWYIVVKQKNKKWVFPKWEFSTTHAPIAKFIYTIYGLKVKFRYTGFDPDGDPVSCLWSFGDGQTGKGCYIEHEYKHYGTFKVTLNVIDSKGAESWVSEKVNLNAVSSPRNGPPFSKDLDGDGLYEDVNGDGKVNMNDVVYLFLHYRSPLFQKYKKYYDFCPDGKLNYKDVLYLYLYVHWHIKRWGKRR